MDRRALIIGAWQAPNRPEPSPQKIISITSRWKRVFEAGRFEFGSLSNKEIVPEPLHNPEYSTIVSEVENASGVSADTELLFFFVGHSVSYGADDVKLILGTTKDGEDRTVRLGTIVDTFLEHGHFGSYVFILDSCHVGRAKPAFQKLEKWYSMFGAGDEYAFDTAFSEGVLKAFERDIQKNDHRIDRRSEGITYQKLFQEARAHVLKTNNGRNQEPIDAGGYGNAVVLEVPPRVSDAFNTFTSPRTVYGRVHRLMEMIHEGASSLSALKQAVHSDADFLLKKDKKGVATYVSSKRIKSYLAFLRKSGWLVQPKGTMVLTKEGIDALDRSVFNRDVLEVIEKKIFEGRVTFSVLDIVIKDLLDNMIPPTPANIRARAIRTKSVVLPLDAASRIALQILPSTGRFGKGAADAIFPPER